MIKDTQETTLGDYITESENSEFVYENTTAGVWNDSQTLPLHSDAKFISATGANIIMNSTMENETLTNEVTPSTDMSNLPSESFQNITLLGTSQMPDIANSTSSQFRINVTLSNVADDITNNTANEHINEILLNSTTDSFLLPSDNLTFTAVHENISGLSVTLEEAPGSIDTGEFNVTTASVPSRQPFIVTDDASVSSAEAEDETTASSPTQLDGLTMVTNESVDTVVEFTTERSWDAGVTSDDSAGGTTDGGTTSGGTIIPDNQSTSKSDAVAVAIGVIIGLLLIAALIIAFMLIRRRIIYR